MIDTFQIIGAIFMILFLLHLSAYLRKNSFDFYVFLLLVVTIFLIIMIILPIYVKAFIFGTLGIKGFERGFDIFLSILSLSGLLLALKSYYQQKVNQNDITSLVQKIALDNKVENKNTR